jgi:hypothetical protein
MNVHHGDASVGCNALVRNEKSKIRHCKEQDSSEEEIRTIEKNINFYNAP